MYILRRRSPRSDSSPTVERLKLLTAVVGLVTAAVILLVALVSFGKELLPLIFGA